MWEKVLYNVISFKYVLRDLTKISFTLAVISKIVRLKTRYCSEEKSKISRSSVCYRRKMQLNSTYHY